MWETLCESDAQVGILTGPGRNLSEQATRHATCEHGTSQHGARGSERSGLDPTRSRTQEGPKKQDRYRPSHSARPRGAGRKHWSRAHRTSVIGPNGRFSALPAQLRQQALIRTFPAPRCRPISRPSIKRARRAAGGGGRKRPEHSALGTSFAPFYGTASDVGSSGRRRFYDVRLCSQSDCAIGRCCCGAERGRIHALFGGV